MINKTYAAKVHLGLSILILAITTPCHSALLEEDFLDTEVGFEPRNAHVTGTGPKTTVKVVEYPALNAPFQSGKGLQFIKTETGTTPEVKWQLSAPIRKGRLKFQAYSLHSTGEDGKDYGQTYFVASVWDGKLSPVSVIFNEGGIGLYDGEDFLKFSEKAYPGLGLAGNVVDVDIAFSAETKTYSVTINGVDIQKNGKFEFAFRHSAGDEFDGVSFGIPGKAFDKLLMYLDGFQIIEK